MNMFRPLFKGLFLVSFMFLISETYAQMTLEVRYFEAGIDDPNVTKPYVIINNTGGTALNNISFQAYYYFTTEGQTPVPEDYYTPYSSISIEALGGNEYRFKYDFQNVSIPAYTVLNPGGEQVGIHYPSFTPIVSSNDYSYIHTGTPVVNTKIPIYSGGSLIFGTPPVYFTLTVNSNNAAYGSVSRDPDLSMYPNGTSVQLTPVPAAGYIFVNWTGDLTGSADPATITMDASKTITAVFSSSIYDLTISTNGNGTTAPTGTVTATDGVPVSISATPDAGYEFNRWEVISAAGTAAIADVSTAATTVTLNGGDAEVRAFFNVTGFVYPEECGSGESMIVDGSAIISQDLTVNSLTALNLVVTPKWEIPPPDYVFNRDYNLPDLNNVKKYIDKNKHLEGIPSAAEFEKNGVNLVDMNMVLLKKIEELTLYTIQLKSRLDKQEEIISGLDLGNKPQSVRKDTDDK